MPRKRRPSNPSEGATPGTMRFYVTPFQEWQRIKGYSPVTIGRYGYHLLRFLTFCEERGVLRPQDASRQLVERYQRHLFHTVTKKGTPLSVTGQLQGLLALQNFFKWLTRERIILYNPASEMEMPRLPKDLPRTVLSAKEAERVLAQPDVMKPHGIRDRAILELLYSTGIRRLELSRLKTYEVDITRSSVFIRQGKGRKDRVVPLGDRAGLWLRKYLTEVRPLFVSGPDTGALFLSNMGQALHPDYLTNSVKWYLQDADIGKKGSCHVFRHTCATLMLEGGADVRYVQALLGHASLETTEIYTHVSIQKLKEVHRNTHPAESKAKKEEPSIP